MFGMVKLQKMHIKDVGLLMVFVLLFCPFIGMHIKEYLKEEVMNGEEEQNQKERRRNVLKTGKKDDGLVYKKRKVTMVS